MNTKEGVKSLQEYVSVPLAELVESSTNPRKTFDEEKLGELAESIRSKGVLSPLLARKVNGHFEIVSGARRYRAAQRVGLPEVPVRIVILDDAEILETQIIENIQRADVHPFDEAQGFRALLEGQGSDHGVANQGVFHSQVGPQGIGTDRARDRENAARRGSFLILAKKAPVFAGAFFALMEGFYKLGRAWCGKTLRVAMFAGDNHEECPGG